MALRRPHRPRLAPLGTAALLLTIVLAVAACGGAAATTDRDRLEFGEVAVGSQGGAQVVNITNEERNALQLVEIGIAGDNPKAFTITDDTTCATAQPLDGGSSCSIAIRFGPNGPGELSARLTVDYDGDGSPIEVDLSGEGAGQSAVTLSTTTLAFAATTIDEESAPQSVQVTNSGTVALQVGAVTIQGDDAGAFRIGDEDCDGASVAPGASCSISVTFGPEDVGDLSATLSVDHDADGSPAEIALQGEGQGRPSASASPSKVSFGDVTVGKASKQSAVTVANQGTGPLTISSIKLTGADAARFSIASSTNCSTGKLVKASNSCKVQIVFKPTKTGTSSATLEIKSDAPESPLQTPLSGRGVEPAETPTEVPAETPTEVPTEVPVETSG